MVSDSLVIPLTKTSPGETVEIFPSELADTEPADILSLLSDENALPSVYFLCAMGYHRQNLYSSHDLICQSGIKLDHSMSKKTVKDQEAIMNLYCSLACSRLTESERLKKQDSQLEPALLKAKIEEMHSEAQDLFTQADKINQFYSTTWCSKGRMLLSQYTKKNDTGVQALERAKYYFNTAERESGEVLPALMGMANVMYLEGSYQKSIDYYVKAIKGFPEEAGSEARVAMGMCCYKLGQVDRAYACFQRAVEIEPQNVNGRVGVGVLRMRSGERSAVEEGVKQIVRARINDVKSPMVNNHLANHFFYAFTPHPGTLKFGSHNKKIAKATSNIEVEVGEEVRIGLDEVKVVKRVEGGEIEFEEEVKESGEKKWYKKDYSKVEEYAKTAYAGTTVPSIQAESCWLIGRVFHVKKEFQQAEKMYKQAVKLDQAFTPALYGYAQLLVKAKDYVPAAKLLESVLKACPNSPDALGLYGSILAKDGTKRSKALKSLKRAVQLKPDDANVHLMYATVLKNNVVDFPGALEAYEKSMDICGKEGEKPTSSTLSNVGVLHFWRKEYDAAEKRLIESIAAEGVVYEGVKSARDVIVKGGDAVIPSIFNLARLFEEKGNHEDAVAIHREIIDAHPAYTNSYVRMATISRDLGAMKHCAAWLEQAFATATDNEQLMCLIGHFWFDNKEYQNSQHIYEKLLNEGSTTMHPYANVALGNIYFATIGTSKGKLANRDKFLKYSEDYFVKALKKDSGNVYAGNGLGCVLAEKGELSKARNVFQRVRECSNDSIPSTLLNMAHLMLAQQQHAPAIVLYRNYLDHNHAEAGSINVHLYISHAYFDWAKAAEVTMKTAMNEEAAKLDERYSNSLEWLTKAKAIDPENKRVDYNEALVRQDFAVAVLKKGTEGLKRSLEDVEGAMKNLKAAKAMFTALSEVDKDTKPRFPQGKCAQWAEYCQTQFTLCEQHLSHEQERAEEDKKKRESQLLAQEKVLEKLKEEQRLAEEEERARKMAEDNAEKIKTMSGQWNSAQKSRKKSEDKKGKKDPNAMEDDSDSSSDDEAVPVAGEAKEKTVDDLFGGSDSDDSDDDVPKPMETKEEEAPPKKSGIGALFDSDSDDDSDVGEPSAKKRKVLVDDDDE
ncbi:hypothetical protein TL16_g01201 [Triparma laevis f. inornata]|uniref:Uncharacterized protein n=1 Tax=Triparma laevis f. inornata TaxID=1714386 RepID=A0A9W7DRQ4_9STRA|nr:hypothetical protein TL16_g01201 [Triparma laevis f. inornata]